MACRLLACYKEVGAVLYPVLPDLDKLERDTNRLLQGRLAAGGVYRPDANGLMKPFGMGLPFLSLLFAVLASGCQLSDRPESERELTSWVYGLWSFMRCLKSLWAHLRSSLVLIPVSADAELRIPTNDGDHPSHYWVSRPTSNRSGHC